MRNILVIFGGRSYEHDISVLTAIQIMGFIDRNNDRILPCYITRDGEKFIAPFKCMSVKSYCRKVRGRKVQFVNGGAKIGLKKYMIDCALVCCHGGGGENGSLSGLLNIYNIPYTCADVLPSAICMDKAQTHENATKIGIKSVDFVTVRKNYDIDKIIDELGDRLIVKPLNLGSSIGVKPAHGKSELAIAIDNALALDSAVIVERQVENLIEYNIAVMRSRGEVKLSGIERPIAGKEVLDFADKYMNDGKMSGLNREFPATVSYELKRAIESAARKAYIELGLGGVVRIDFLYDSVKGELYMNEINTVPGSLAYYLFDTEPRKLLDRLIDEGITYYNRKNLYEHSYKSNVLECYKSNRPSKLRK